MSFQTKTKKIFHTLLPSKRLLTVLFLVVLVLGFSLSFTNTSHATFEFTSEQKKQFIDAAYGDSRINTLYSQDEKGRALIEQNVLPEYASKYNSYDEATKALKSTTFFGQPAENPDTVSASLNQFSPSAVGGLLGQGLAAIVLRVVIGVLVVLAGFCKWLLMFGGWALDATLDPNLYNFTNNKMIVEGWVIVRDVCNLFFLLVLLFIAICTILKIEKYHAKKTLLMLIIMALLINFSKPIAIFIFDGSQLLMNFFLSKMGRDPSTQFVGQIAMLIYDTLMKELVPKGTSLEIAVYYLFVVVFLFMFAVAMFVTAIFMVIRIVAVMILIIVSPLAFFAAIVPDFSKMSSSWWNALFKYCYYGPAAAFFLYLATNFAISGNVLPKLNSPNGGLIIMSLIQYLTVLVFLYASIIMSQQFGIFAANAVVGNANRFMKWGAGMTKGGGMWGAGARGVAWGAKTTGATGAVTQRLQQSKLGRLLTKSGREEALEEREAAIAEKIGVKGAKERQTRKRAKKYKDEAYSEAALKAMAAKGDEAAAYRLAEDGNMDDATYSALIPKIKDPKLKKLLDDKTKEKTIDVYINYKAKNEAAALAATTGMTIAAAESQIAGEEYNKMNADNWKNQKEKSRIFTSTYTTEAAAGFNNLNSDAQKDVGKSVSGKDRVVMTAGGANIP